MISCDNKAKIPLGLPCVNRLSSLSHKFFIEGPNFQDHDLRTGYLINPEGYLVLEFNSDCIDEELYLYELNVEGTTQETVDLSETRLMNMPISIYPLLLMNNYKVITSRMCPGLIALIHLYLKIMMR